jgi:altronate dehydratase
LKVIERIALIMNTAIPLTEVARLAAADDNVAIITRTLPAGTQIIIDDEVITLAHTLLEAHRLALRPVAAGEHLLSWGKPFGTAIAPIRPGDYIVNDAMLAELRSRKLDFPLPAAPNFSDDVPPYVFDEERFTAAPPLPSDPDALNFMGYVRPGSRGVGTRNLIVLLGTSSLTGAFVRALETRLHPLAEDCPNLDGIVAVAHTEGGGAQPNNRELLLRTLAGFMVHPNVGAVLAVDHGIEAVTNAHLREYLRAHDYPLADTTHAFFSLRDGFTASLERAEGIVRGWLPAVTAQERQRVSACHLKIALQCGGSDAFSGISGNPLAAQVARAILRSGGSANLAETDELVGAEAYVLDRVKDADTVRAFIAMRDRFAAQLAQHGHSVLANPSGGNLYRGLYNIYLKSLGAAAKRAPDVRLDAVIDYGERMTAPGFYFMNSPGNDLESVAGQVAAGCNLIFFVTGNGSITNFPFVPTIKIVTTTARYELLPAEMDVNAGAYLDGVSMDALTEQTVALTQAVASGQRTAGERAGHAQVQIWRDWHTPGQTTARDFSGEAHTIQTDVPVRELRIPMFAGERGPAAEQISMILPTSLCSGQIARLCAEQITERHGRRCVALVHTEGCGTTSETEFNRTMLGYLTHPSVQHVMLLEHGCEKTHNAYMRALLSDAGIDPQTFGWASVQLDGGIQAAMDRMSAWFAERFAAEAPPSIREAGMDAVRIGLLTRSTLPAEAARALDQLAREIVGGGGLLVLPDHDGLRQHSEFLPELDWQPTLGYAQSPRAQGLHLMHMPFDHWNETLVGLGAAGVDMILALTTLAPLPGHPLIPVAQVAAGDGPADDYDLVLRDDDARMVDRLFALITAVLGRDYQPRQHAQANVDFQITRGLHGVSV